MPVVGGYKELLTEIEKLARSKPVREWWIKAYKDYKIKTETNNDPQPEVEK